MVVIYKILQWADKFREGTIYRCEWNKFFLQKVLPRGFLLYAKRERRGEKGGEVGKCTFNLTFLRMRVNNTYPMESYFFPLKTRSACTLHAECFTVRERERDTESVSPGPPTIYPSILPVQQERGELKKGACLVITPGPITQVM